jgi:hypothetical protein
MASKKKGYSNHEIYILQQAFGKSKLTITRWIKSKNDLLTSQKAKDAFTRASAFRPEYFLKDYIFVINGEMVRCLISDNELSCVAPFSVSKSGIKTKASESCVYATKVENNGSIEIYTAGRIENGKLLKL